ncbi:hypothetical protein [Thalassobius sp. MITS945101]|uniref:hypothetical protein n=1 Tax=Thalassobius sp. MITS945101 TaxID=3096994 RepID=UPI00399AFC64
MTYDHHSPENIEKRSQFLTIVQTTIMAFSAESHQNDKAKEFNDLYAFNLANEAVEISHLIPPDMTAGKAAKDFLRQYLWNDEGYFAPWISDNRKEWANSLSASAIAF